MVPLLDLPYWLVHTKSQYLVQKVFEPADMNETADIIVQQYLAANSVNKAQTAAITVAGTNF